MPTGTARTAPHEEGLVVADGEVAEDLALHAHRRVHEQGRPGGAEPPVDRGELVDLVPGLLAEEARQVDLVARPGGGVPCPTSARRRRGCGSPSRCRRGSSAGRCCTGSRNRPGSRSSRRRGPYRDDVERVVDPVEEGREIPLPRRLVSSIRRPETHRRSSSPRTEHTANLRGVHVPERRPEPDRLAAPRWVPLPVLLGRQNSYA